MKIEDKRFGRFRAFGSDGILRIHTTDSGVDGINLVEGDDGIVPYVTRSATNNGISEFLNTENYRFGSNDGGTITVGLDTQTAFYQPYRYITGQNIQIVEGDFDACRGLFYSAVLRHQMRVKFNWGGNGATLGRLNKMDILLPMTENGEPDYGYMDDYVRINRRELLNRYSEYVFDRMNDLGETVAIPALTEKTWAPYPVASLFSSFVNGKSKGLNHLTRSDEGGAVPYIAATNRNNGVCCHIGRGEDVSDFIQPGNCIGFIKNGDGSAGFAVYEPTDFISTSDVVYGYADWLNGYTGPFFVTCQDMTESKYSHGHKRGLKHLLVDRVMLPSDDAGKTDFAYMEQYARNMMIAKYRQYLAHIGRV